jgi:hypothetical protein
MTDTDTSACPRCHGLTVMELLVVRDTPMPTEEGSRWRRSPEVPLVLQPVPVYQVRCLCCGGVQFL